MAFGKSAEISRLSQELAEAREANSILTSRLESVDRVAELASRELAALEVSPVIGEEVEVVAAGLVVASERERMVREMAEVAKAERYDEFAARVRAEEGPDIKANMVKTFEADGTFNRIDAEARNEVLAEIQAEVLAERMRQVREELATDEKRKAFKESVAQEVEESEELQRFREQVRAELEQGWREEAIDAAQDTIRAEEAGREQGFIASFTASYLESDQANRRRKKIRDDNESEWQGLALEEIAARMEDEELAQLLGKKAEQAKEKLRKETQAAELLAKFEGKGLDVSSLPEDTELVIYLGDTGERTVVEKRQDRYGYEEKVDVHRTYLSYDRILTLSSRGDGRFVVDGDTLLDAELPYIRDNAINRGTIITIGRKILDNGDPKLDQVVAADVPLYYDTDVTDEDITDAQLSVANVKVDGISARSFDIIEKHAIK